MGGGGEGVPTFFKEGVGGGGEWRPAAPFRGKFRANGFMKVKDVMLGFRMRNKFTV